METNFLIMSVVLATLGFIAWFMLSTSLLLPARFQVLYDANPPYVARIYRRRMLGVFIFGILPLMIIYWTNLLDHTTLGALNIHFHWSKDVAKWVLIGVPIIILGHAFAAKKTSSLEQFPEIRVRFWRPHIFIKNAVYWVLYIAAYEFLYRGLLLQSLLLHVDELLAVVIATGIYAMVHYYKRNRVSLASIFYGALSCYIVLRTGSLLPVIILHLANVLVLDIWSLKYHPEMYFLKT